LTSHLNVLRTRWGYNLKGYGMKRQIITVKAKWNNFETEI
jgi:hypothetical protein